MVVTGAAGFLGSHMVARLLDAGVEVVGLDDLSSGRVDNLAAVMSNPSFELRVADVSDGFTVDGAVDAVLHLASPASPVDYLARPIETLRVGSEGTRAALELALDRSARFFLSSTSEIYGDPLVHPQPETYWGNVNPIGVRSVYDEAKRYAEALTYAHARAHGLDVRVARIFNTYGPHMRPDDGRVVSNFIVQALSGHDLTVYGDGRQTRSFCYVDDEIDGLLALLDSDVEDPVNIGNDGEFDMLTLAELVLELTGSSSRIVHEDLPLDDPRVRRPDLTRARTELGWEPRVSLRDGLIPTIAYFASITPSA
ncbi:MAG: SDR family oxidoreductase [Acidimicrobiia bacterium]|nr:SDR family oxidoreductase [Acidimicrobiia bacterium]